MGIGSDVIDVLPGSVKVEPEKKLKHPKMYRVILYNDDYTTMDFVVQVLVSIFDKPLAEATRIMLDVHKSGRGICGTYTFDIAMTKIRQVHFDARNQGFPLRCGYEEV